MSYTDGHNMSSCTYSTRTHASPMTFATAHAALTDITRNADAEVVALVSYILDVRYERESEYERAREEQKIQAYIAREENERSRRTNTRSTLWMRQRSPKRTEQEP